MLSAQEHAIRVRARLMNPPNAVHDYAIDLTRLPLLREMTPIAPKHDPDEVFGPVVHSRTTTLTQRFIEDEIEEAERRLSQLRFLRKDLLETGYQARPSLGSIQRRVCAAFNVPLTDMRSSRRTSTVMLPRHIAMHLCRALTLHSLPEIGSKFGKDHTSILHADRKIVAMREADPAFNSIVHTIEKSLVAFSPPPEDAPCSLAQTTAI
jgi:hypothetical protein